MVGSEERRVAKRFRGFGDGELVGVGGALLRFDEYAEVHGLSLEVTDIMDAFVRLLKLAVEGLVHCVLAQDP